MLVFDRNRQDHAWGRALDELSTAEDATHRGLAENWRMDHRLSVEREEVMLDSGLFGPEPSGQEWLADRWQHYSRRICQPSDAAAAGPTSETLEPCNGNNRIDHRPPGHEQLIHIESFNGLLRRLSQPGNTTEDEKEEFENLTGYPLPARLPGEPMNAFSAKVDRLAAEVTGRGTEAARALARWLCDTLGASQPLWWACFAEEVRDLLAAADGGGLCRALGLGHLREGDWLLVWRYDALVARFLYRPTVVEAGGSAFHHPSPAASKFGVTMPLEAALPSCREFLHRPLKGQAAADGCTGRMLRIESLAPINDDRFKELRREHRRRLRQEFPDRQTLDWLERHFPTR